MVSERGLDDRSKLDRTVNATLSQNLRAGETVRVIIHGLIGSAFVGTDRRLFVFRKQLWNLKTASWGYETITGVAMDLPMMGRRFVEVHAAGEHSDLTKMQIGGGSGDSDRAKQGIAVLRQLIADYEQRSTQRPPLQQASASIVEQLRELAGLRDAAIITASEFEAKKAELLQRM